MIAIIEGTFVLRSVLNAYSVDPLDTSHKKRKRLHAMVGAMYYATLEIMQGGLRNKTNDKQDAKQFLKMSLCIAAFGVLSLDFVILSL
jgi:hypothetical protein